ncbi:hypothetical protein L1987_79440 [Smallanthus sonchifolius]|uniref:Uncharacterized protein n=1 Tax=Smallanthus sonchifolius TaxID=185202 RepID=A0ACB8ZFB7_9ASTR|nr:hypothetical protein L1987_79440 [Smallanthus sonchifolius]
MRATTTINYRKYGPDNHPVVISFDRGSSSNNKVKTTSQPNNPAGAGEESMPNVELFGFDSLVSILGLKR